MKRYNSWDEGELKLLRDEYATCADPRELAVKIGRSYKAMRTMAKRFGLYRIAPKPVNHCTATEAEDQFIIANHATMPQRRMAKELNRSHQFVSDRMRKLNLYSKERARHFARESQLKKGATPPNKGKKWDEFMSKEAQQASRKTIFKKGNKPQNTKHDGCVSIRHHDKSGRSYKYIRIAEGKWIPYHQHKWRKHRGKIPKGHIIVFKDGDNMNCRLSYLECITLEENMKRNTYHNYPKPIAQLIQLRGALQRQINKHEKQNKRPA